MEQIPFPASIIYSKLITKSPIMRQFYKETAKEISDYIKEGKVLDIGTGPGRLPIEIAKLNNKIEVIGIDLSESMIKIAKQNAEKSKLNNLSFKYGSSYKIPFSDKSIDLIVSTASYHHWKEKDKAFDEIYRVLKPGKEFWIYEFDREFSKKDIIKITKKHHIPYIPIYIALKIISSHSSYTKKKFNNDFLNNKFDDNHKIEKRGIFLKGTVSEDKKRSI